MGLLLLHISLKLKKQKQKWKWKEKYIALTIFQIFKITSAIMCIGISNCIIMAKLSKTSADFYYILCKLDEDDEE